MRLESSASAANLMHTVTPKVLYKHNVSDNHKSVQNILAQASVDLQLEHPFTSKHLYCGVVSTYKIYMFYTC